jgi:hypothetical protein
MPPIPFQVSKHNTWPFMLLMAGLALLTALPSVFEDMDTFDKARTLRVHKEQQKDGKRRLKEARRNG